jgi:hypothetical protein
MRDVDISERADGEGEEAVGDQAVPVVSEEAGRAYFGRVYAVVQPEWGDDDEVVDWDQSLARQDDAYWSWMVMRARFSWQLFTNWWIARRWIVPRDVTRR